jgi:hypothetical protein
MTPKNQIVQITFMPVKNRDRPIPYSHKQQQADEPAQTDL